MLKPATCSSLEIAIDKLRISKDAFLLSYGRFGSAERQGSVEQLRNQKRELEESIESLSKEIYLFTLEKTIHVRKQYEDQVALLKERRVLQEGIAVYSFELERENAYFVLGIDGKNYPVPSFDDIAQQLYEQRELMRIKMDQGFTKLLLVPFAASILTLANYGHVTGNANGIFTNPGIASADTNREMFYGQEVIDTTFQGSRKDDILKQNEAPAAFATRGWRVVFAQAMEEGGGLASAIKMSKRTARGSILPRWNLPWNGSANGYLQYLLAEQSVKGSSYEGESGMCLEDWIIASVQHFQETGKHLNTSEDGGVSNLLLGCSVSVADGQQNAAVMGYWESGDGLVASTAEADTRYTYTNTATVVKVL